MLGPVYPEISSEGLRINKGQKCQEKIIPGVLLTEADKGKHSKCVLLRSW